jgi:hypothetical protein
MSKELEEEIKASLANGRLPCAVAFRIVVRELKVSTGAIGKACNNLRIKISSCQLGYFP